MSADDIAVGGWRCPCGGLTIDTLTASPAVISAVPSCPSCGRTVEIIPLATADPTPQTDTNT